jgi:hypothetical protein
MPRVRFTIKRMMVWVALTAFIINSGFLTIRAGRYHALAREHHTDAMISQGTTQWAFEELRVRDNRIAEQLRQAADADKRASAAGEDVVTARAWSDHASRLRALAEREERMKRPTKEEFTRGEALRVYHKRLEAKYRYAEAHPWLSTEPDPPPP